MTAELSTLSMNPPGWMRSRCERMASQREPIYLGMCSVLGFKTRSLREIFSPNSQRRHQLSGLRHPFLPMSSNGLRKLDRVLIRKLNGNCYRKLSRRITRGPNPRYLALACRLINEALRIDKRLAKRDPHLFGPHARAYYRDTVAQERLQEHLRVSLDKIYGPSPPETSAPPPSIWTERYETWPADRKFRKWFREIYGD